MEFEFKTYYYLLLFDCFNLSLISFNLMCFGSVSYLFNFRILWMSLYKISSTFYPWQNHYGKTVFFICQPSIFWTRICSTEYIWSYLASEAIEATYSKILYEDLFSKLSLIVDNKSFTMWIPSNCVGLIRLNFKIRYQNHFVKFWNELEVLLWWLWHSFFIY